MANEQVFAFEQPVAPLASRPCLNAFSHRKWRISLLFPFLKRYCDSIIKTFLSLLCSLWKKLFCRREICFKARRHPRLWILPLRPPSLFRFCKYFLFPSRGSASRMTEESLLWNWEVCCLSACAIFLSLSLFLFLHSVATETLGKSLIGRRHLLSTSLTELLKSTKERGNVERETQIDLFVRIQIDTKANNVENILAQWIRIQVAFVCF